MWIDEIAYDMIAEFLDKDKNTLVLEMKEKYPSVETSELEECYDQILELKDKVVYLVKIHMNLWQDS